MAQISVEERTRDKLRALKRGSETYDDVVKLLIQQRSVRKTGESVESGTVDTVETTDGGQCR